MKNIIHSRIQNAIELLYQYKQSIFYQLHFAIVMCLGIVFLYVFLREWRIKDQAYEYKDLKVNPKKSLE